jgi:4-amino-4-deoxy-L-arabinose transferase-like glycosyltransferase
LVLRLLVALFWVKQPGFVDAYYYYQAAQNWHEGHGFVINTVWNYQITSFNPPNPTFGYTHPAFDYWNPLSSWLIIGSFALFGVSPFAASLPFMLCATLLPPLAFYAGKLAFGEAQRRYSWVMAVATLFPGRYFLFWNAPDNFANFALLGLLCFITIHLGLNKDDRWLVLAGVFSGLAYLCRSDGVLFTATLVLSFLWLRWRPQTGLQIWKPRWGMLGLALIAAISVVTPWLWRNLSEFGTLFSPNSSKVLWVRTYNELFSHSLSLTPARYFEWGFGNIIMSKLNALEIGALILSAQGLFLLAPFFLLGIFLLTFKNRAYAPFLIHLTLLYFGMALVFTEISLHGTLFHAAGSLIPYQAGAALFAIEWLARKYSVWRKRPNRFKFFANGIAVPLLVVSAVITLITSASGASNWDNDFNYAVEINDWFKANGISNYAIIIGEPLSYYYATGNPAIALASDGVAANLEAACRFGANYLVLGVERYSALDALYKDKSGAIAAGLKLQFIAEFKGSQIYRIEPVN